MVIFVAVGAAAIAIECECENESEQKWARDRNTRFDSIQFIFVVRLGSSLNLIDRSIIIQRVWFARKSRYVLQ